MTKTSLSQFYAGLKRRKVIRVAVVYVVIAWLIVEVASVMFPGLLLPEWSVRLVIGLAILGFPIALVMAWAIELTPDGLKAEVAPDGEKDQAVPVPLPAKDGFDSIAVLPFLKLSNDPENEYFSEGMSEEVLNLLCKLPQLTVASRTSSFSFKGKDVDLGTVAITRNGVSSSTPWPCSRKPSNLIPTTRWHGPARQTHIPGLHTG
jgi:adenylate cyclase